MNILLLSTGINYGGAYKILVWLANNLAEKGHNVTILTYRSDKACSGQKISPKVRHLNIPLETSGGKIIQCMKTVVFLHRHIKKESYQIGIAFLPPSQVRLVMACMGTDTISLVSQRGDPLQRPVSKSKFVPGWLMDRIISHARSFVFQTEIARDLNSWSKHRRSVVIPNPVIPLNTTSCRRPEKRIVCIARLDIKNKGQDILIKAFNSISSLIGGYVLELYGSGRDERELRSLTCGNPDIKFMGAVTDIPQVLRNAAFFVLPSRHEGIPNALLEAMSLGVPSICTDYSPVGCATAILGKGGGLVVESSNVSAMADAMMRFIQDPKYAESCGQAGKYVCIDFSETRIFQMWERHLTSLT